MRPLTPQNTTQITTSSNDRVVEWTDQHKLTELVDRTSPPKLLGTQLNALYRTPGVGLLTLPSDRSCKPPQDNSQKVKQARNSQSPGGGSELAFLAMPFRYRRPCGATPETPINVANVPVVTRGSARIIDRIAQYHG
jgi:hypothetical protein